MVVEYALKDVHKPIGVSEYIITKNLPKEFKSSLPSIEEIETELDSFAQQNGDSKRASNKNNKRGPVLC
jgi:hypothetical protein